MRHKNVLLNWSKPPMAGIEGEVRGDDLRLDEVWVWVLCFPGTGVNIGHRGKESIYQCWTSAISSGPRQGRTHLHRMATSCTNAFLSVRQQRILTAQLTN